MKRSSNAIDKSYSIKVIVEDPKSHPVCPHGPTLLFSKNNTEEVKRFFACSAYRDRKHCGFFQWADKSSNLQSTEKLEARKVEQKKFLKGINHRKAYVLLNKIKSLGRSNRGFCHDCKLLFNACQDKRHENHSAIIGLTDYQLEHPSEMLKPLDETKKEAQYLFSKTSVEFIVETFRRLGYQYVICVGTPRIHEYIQSNVGHDMQSILLDLDDRFHSFFGPMEFCWYNSFNNHFFFDEAQGVFEDFLRNTRGERTVLITDPPFGGRIEPLAYTLSVINKLYMGTNKTEETLPIFWIFPYFMEPQILNYLPEFNMLDYKVNYDNHPLFQGGPKGRKNGSPVRIFTNVLPSLVKLPKGEYKFCKRCDKWVSKENKHCHICEQCTSKNGQTYVHCKQCDRCVKPSWQHCHNCQRCAQVRHQCGLVLEFNGACLNCQRSGHKRANCPDLLPALKNKKTVKK
ncbi:rRNA N6-adenosine-methyltransferase ZCCHC4 isoform X1 [Anthonomus grandis grandis]|uniref:rRNA N6-adenosine-methyltransferase ZCCHC4 isoform X1 n=1 Tax=Anthonomus grandis grandis TaxID=2921223 RepID=UPI002165D4F9|nr:rRNA N6-adenosine-methyltransferase ZCCHC4 isoform X1 [Anthonomus grandis grandis]